MVDNTTPLIVDNLKIDANFEKLKKANQFSSIFVYEGLVNFLNSVELLEWQKKALFESGLFKIFNYYNISNAQQRDALLFYSNNPTIPNFESLLDSLILDYTYTVDNIANIIYLNIVQDINYVLGDGENNTIITNDGSKIKLILDSSTLDVSSQYDFLKLIIPFNMQLEITIT